MDTGIRNTAIRELIKLIVEKTGLPIYRNPEYRGEKAGQVTVLQVVAEEFGLSERTVEDIWRDRKATIEAARPTAH
jgi:hypothetical protein